MGDPFTGAALGVLLAEVIKAAKKAIVTVQMFKPRLENICSTLARMHSLVEQMTNLDEELNIPKDELQQIHKIVHDCQCIIAKCLNVKLMKIGSLYSLSKKLLALEDRLDNFCRMDLIFIIARDIKATRVKVEEINRLNTSTTTADLALGALVGALIAELISLKKAIEATHLEIIQSSAQSEDELNTFNNSSQLEELRPIHGLLKTGLCVIKKCRKLRKYQFWDKQFNSTNVVKLDNVIRSLCQVDLVGLLFGNVKINTVDLAEEMARLSRVLLEKDITIPFQTCDVPPCPELVVSFGVTFRNIKTRLLEREEAVIVITGGGGYGKTTLVMKLCHQEDVRGKYIDIIFIVASESTGLMAVIQQIIIRLGGQISDPDALTEDDAVKLLKKLLAERAKQNPILLILDDLWYGAESILDKFVNKDIKNYVLLVTSRSELPGFGYSHKLKGLGEEQAIRLLRYAATPLNGHIIPVDITTINEIAERCEGSPLALTLVGRSLCEKPESAWVATLKDWSNGMPLFVNLDDQLNRILTSLMNSLKSLDGTEELERVKKCFLDLGSFPKGRQICVAALVDMWSVLYGIDANGVDAIAAVIELSERNLLGIVTTRESITLQDGYYNNVHVMQTDLLRELIIHLNTEASIEEERKRVNLNINKNNLPEWLVREHKQPFKAKLVSICTDEEFSSALPELELPEAEVLVLNFNTKQNYTLPNFIKKMVNLKILIVTNNGPLPVMLSNFHLVASLENLKKIRLERIKIDSRTLTGFCLAKLEKISAYFCEISNENQTSDLQIPKMFPKLEEIDISYCQSLKELPNGICHAKTLKKISIVNCQKLSELPGEIGNLSKLQVLRLKNCAILERLPTSAVNLKELSFLDISNCIGIDPLPDQIGELHQLKELHLSGCLKLFPLPSSVSKLEKLEYLIIDEDQENLSTFFNGSPNLKLITTWV